MDHLGGVNASRGLLTAVHKSIFSEEFQLNTNLEAQAIKIHSQLNLTICNLYLPPAEPIPEIEIHRLIQQLPTPFIIVGDVNAQHGAWGLYRRYGREIKQQKGLEPLNPKKKEIKGLTKYSPWSGTHNARQLTARVRRKAPR